MSSTDEHEAKFAKGPPVEHSTKDSPRSPGEAQKWKATSITPTNEKVEHDAICYDAECAEKSTEVDCEYKVDHIICHVDKS